VQQDSTTKIRRQTQSQLASAVLQVATAPQLQQLQHRFAQFAGQERTVAHHHPPLAPIVELENTYSTTATTRSCTTLSMTASFATLVLINTLLVLPSVSRVRTERLLAQQWGQRVKRRPVAFPAFAQ